jgi:hypothetical protein
MKCLGPKIAAALGLFALVTAVYGVTDDSASQERNYHVIIDRNPFGLKPPPPPPTNMVAAPEKNKDEILLTGITSIGSLRAYFMTKAPQGKNPEFYSLGVEDKKDGLEVLEISPTSQSVRVRNAGVESVMTFAANGVKAPASPASPAPGTPPAPGTAAATHTAGVTTVSPAPPAMTATPGAANNRLRTIPSRMRGPNMAGMEQPAMTAGQPFQGAQPLQGRPNPAAAETDVILMEAQRQANPNTVFPPTPGLPMPMQ